MVIVTVTIKAAFMDRDAWGGMEDAVAEVAITNIREGTDAETCCSMHRECDVVDVPDVDEDEPSEAYTTWHDLAYEAMDAPEASVPWDSPVHAQNWRAGYEPEVTS